MRYADITTCDIANGEGIGVVLWCQGCSLDCCGCQNKCTHAKSEGKEFTSVEEDLIITELSRKHISRLTLSGGHPLEPYNIEEIAASINIIVGFFPLFFPITFKS